MVSKAEGATTGQQQLQALQQLRANQVMQPSPVLPVLTCQLICCQQPVCLTVTPQPTSMRPREL